MPVDCTPEERAAQEVRTPQAAAGSSPIASTASTPSSDPTTPKCLSPLEESPLVSRAGAPNISLVAPCLQAKEGHRPQPEGASSEVPSGSTVGILHLPSKIPEESPATQEEDLEESEHRSPEEALNPDTLDTRVVMGEETSCSPEETGNVNRLCALIPEREMVFGDALQEVTLHLRHTKVEENFGLDREKAVVSEPTDDLHFEFALKDGLFSQGESVVDVPSFLKPTKESPCSSTESDVRSLQTKPASNTDSDPYTTAPSTPVKNMYSQYKHHTYTKSHLNEEHNDPDNDNMSSPPTSPSGSYVTAEGGSWASSVTSSGSPSCSPNLMAEVDTIESPTPYPDHMTVHDEGLCEDPCCMSPDMLEDEDLPELYDRDIDPEDFSPAIEELIDGYPSDLHSSEEEDEDEWETDFAPSFTSIPLCPEFISTISSLTTHVQVPHQGSPASCSANIEGAPQPAGQHESQTVSLATSENDHMIPAFMLPFRGSLIFEAESMEITLFPQGETAESEAIDGEKKEKEDGENGEDDEDESTSASYLHSLSETSINEGVDESFAYQDDTSESSDSASYDGEEDDKRYGTEEYAVTTDSAAPTTEGPAKSQHDSSNSGCESEMETSSDLSDSDEDCAVFTALDMNGEDLLGIEEQIVKVNEATNEERERSGDEHDEVVAISHLAQGFSEDPSITQDSSSELEDSSTSKAPHEVQGEPIRSTLVLTTEMQPNCELSPKLKEREDAMRTWSDSPIEQQSSTSSSEMDHILRAGIGNVGECLIACFDTDEELDTLPPLCTTVQTPPDDRTEDEENGRRTSMAVQLAEDGNYFSVNCENNEDAKKCPTQTGEDQSDIFHEPPCTMTSDERDLEPAEIDGTEEGNTHVEDTADEELFACYDSEEDPEEEKPLDRSSLLAQIHRQQEEAAGYITNQSSHNIESDCREEEQTHPSLGGTTIEEDSAGTTMDNDIIDGGHGRLNRSSENESNVNLVESDSSRSITSEMSSGLGDNDPTKANIFSGEETATKEDITSADQAITTPSALKTSENPANQVVKSNEISKEQDDQHTSNVDLDRLKKCPFSSERELLTICSSNPNEPATAGHQGASGCQVSKTTKVDESSDMQDHPVFKEPPDREDVLQNSKQAENNEFITSGIGSVLQQSNSEMDNSFTYDSQPERVAGISSELEDANRQLNKRDLSDDTTGDNPTLKNVSSTTDIHQDSCISSTVEDHKETAHNPLTCPSQLHPNVLGIQKSSEKDGAENPNFIKKNWICTGAKEHRKPLDNNVAQEKNICGSHLSDVDLDRSSVYKTGQQEETHHTLTNTLSICKTSKRSSEEMSTEPRSCDHARQEVRPPSASAFSGLTSKPRTDKMEISGDLQEMTKLLQGSFGKLEVLDLSVRSCSSETIASITSTKMTKIIESSDVDIEVVALPENNDIKVNDVESQAQKVGFACGMEKQPRVERSPEKSLRSEKVDSRFSKDKKVGDDQEQAGSPICLKSGKLRDQSSHEVFKAEDNPEQDLKSGFSKDLRTSNLLSKNVEHKQQSPTNNANQLKFSNVDAEHELCLHVAPKTEAALPPTPDTINPGSAVIKVPLVKPLSPTLDASPQDQKLVRRLAASENPASKKLSSAPEGSSTTSNLSAEPPFTSRCPRAQQSQELVVKKNQLTCPPSEQSSSSDSELTSRGREMHLLRETSAVTLLGISKPLLRQRGCETLSHRGSCNDTESNDESLPELEEADLTDPRTSSSQNQLAHCVGSGEESISKAKQSRSEKKARKVTE
ncbi:uncharacterized protein LOC142652250 isoform X2 [Rhinoderma darwinii]|uniref:uncharacterized protein LOC142652250 isoform X2 n=1 Tax=Rhinoderma darwinii TaxID=43563 RepID=UPI003F68086D